MCLTDAQTDLVRQAITATVQYLDDTRARTLLTLIVEYMRGAEDHNAQHSEQR